MRRDPVIIGGGPAGSAAAVTIARAGHAPVLLERSAGPAHKVCGDFLGPDTIALLGAIGCDPAALGAEPINCVRLLQGTRTAETALPFPALSLSRRSLDDALLTLVRQAGADVRMGQHVRRLHGRPGGWTVETGSRLEADTVFLATGKHDLRDHARSRAATAIGLKQYLRLSRAARDDLAGTTELTLFPGGYAGLQPVEDGQAAFCVAVQREAFQRVGGSWDHLLAAIAQSCPAMGDRLADALPVLPRPMAVAGIPYGYLRRDGDNGLFHLGDQTAVIPSLTGDGMAVALYSGQAAAHAWMSGRDAASFHQALHTELRGQFRLAGLMHHVFLHRWTQGAVVRTASLLPALIRITAAHTRLPGPVPTVAGVDRLHQKLPVYR